MMFVVGVRVFFLNPTISLGEESGFTIFLKQLSNDFLENLYGIKILKSSVILEKT